jgi:hypothetical protein
MFVEIRLYGIPTVFIFNVTFAMSNGSISSNIANNGENDIYDEP